MFGRSRAFVIILVAMLTIWVAISLSLAIIIDTNQRTEHFSYTIVVPPYFNTAVQTAISATETAKAWTYTPIATPNSDTF